MTCKKVVRMKVDYLIVHNEAGSKLDTEFNCAY